MPRNTIELGEYYLTQYSFGFDERTSLNFAGKDGKRVNIESACNDTILAGVARKGFHGRKVNIKLEFEETYLEEARRLLESGNTKESVSKALDILEKLDK